MGCNGSTQAASSPPQEQVVPKLRRRLSLGEIGDESEPTKGDEVSDEDRSLLLRLTQQPTFEYIQAAGDRFSVGTETDTLAHMVGSFGSKQVKLDGIIEFDSPKMHIGFACKKGLKPEAPNQDSFLILKLADQYALYGVFDGHGRNGHDVSNFVKDNMPKILFSCESFASDPKTALLETFAQTQHLLAKATAMNTLDATRSGTTCSLVLHCIEKKIMYIAHVGDSRVVLGRQAQGGTSIDAIDLTIDHKPQQKEERARIEKAGGIVIFDGGWNYRVFAKDKIDSRGKRYPGLNMSRAMGDLNGFNDAGISAIPDVAERPCREIPKLGEFGEPTASSAPENGDSDTNRDKFMLLCSDGVWEFISSQEAIVEVAKFPVTKAREAAEHLAALAWERWMKEMDGQVVDDITALVVHFE